MAEDFEHIFLPAQRQDGDDVPTPAPVIRVTVRKGQSLWAIAEKWSGANTPHAIQIAVNELVAVNADKQFDKAYTLQVGEELKIPAEWDAPAAKG